MAALITISIPEELKADVENYNSRNPYNKISYSKVAQAAIYTKLIEMKG